jgi:GNAT superfamily N-acetyltransferase
MNLQTRLSPALAADAQSPAVALRPARPEDTEGCGRLIHAAFAELAARHGFAPDFASTAAAAAMVEGFLADATVHAVVATSGAEIVGVNFLHQGDRVRTVGPIAVAPAWQGAGVGRRLMQAVLDRAGPQASVRLLQDAFNTASMALYASLGFAVKEPVLLLAGMPHGPAPTQGSVRRMRSTDIPACAALCKAVHGITRTHELNSPHPARIPFVIERDGRITGYLTAPGCWLLNHGVAESPGDLRGLLVGAAAVTRQPASLLLPARGNALLGWALEQGMKVVKPMTLMARGAYQQPRGAWFPSVFY